MHTLVVNIELRVLDRRQTDSIQHSEVLVRNDGINVLRWIKRRQDCLLLHQPRDVASEEDQRRLEQFVQSFTLLGQLEHLLLV